MDRKFLSRLSHDTFSNALACGSSSPQYMSELVLIFLDALISRSREPFFHSEVNLLHGVRTIGKRTRTDGGGKTFDPSSMNKTGCVTLLSSNDTLALDMLMLRFDV